MPHFDLEGFIKAVSYFGVAGVVFAETGLFFGIFLPGDSLLFTAGFLASQGHLNIFLLCLVCFLAAVVGDSVGYYIGDRMGRRLFTKPQSRVFKPSNLIKAQAFFDKHGGKAIILGRFMPIVRTMVPMVAGAGTMQYRRFFTYNVVGAFLWGVCIPMAGYFLGSTIPGVDKYLLPIILVIIVVSIAPSAYHIWKENGELIKAEARRRLTERRT
ncbi:MAG TPA: VTT domain-containing protein [Thermomicrobiales bacterium]|jgi:membrane-associated protein|nr:VTT domain-containing protein [Thermomicrobiales bacterium]